MKIVYFIDRISTPGGMERVLTIKANKLSGLGHQLSVITTGDGKQKPYFSLNKNIKVFYLAIERPLSKFEKFRSLFKEYYNPRHYEKVVEILNIEKPDICISMFNSERCFLYKINDGSKKIVEFHFSRRGLIEVTKVARFPRLTRWYFNNIKLKQYEKIIQRYNAAVLLTYQDKKTWKNLKNTFVIANPNTFRVNENRLPDYSQKVILSVGKIHYQKGFDLLIKSWAILEEKYPDWKLKIIGKRENKFDYLDEIIDKSGLRNIEILLAIKKIEEAYYNSSIYVGSSRYEGFPMTILEAMSCGLPVVFFNTPTGPAEIITDNQDGLIAEYLNIQDLAHKLSVLMDDKEKREKMGRKAKDNVKRFDQDNIIPKWEELFKQILK